MLEIADDLTVATGRARMRLSPGEAFRTAERLIRTATVRMITEETDRVAGDASDRAVSGKQSLAQC
jgi:hypothetical protein